MIGEEHVVTPDVAANVSEELKQTIEVLIFASDEPLTVQMIRDVIDEGNQQREPSVRLEASNGDVHSADRDDFRRGRDHVEDKFNRLNR